MDNILNFLTKELIDKAAFEIDKNGIPSKRGGTGYAVMINNKQYPYKLLVTEAAILDKVNVTSHDFSSNANNRLGFEKITGYGITDLKEKMDYFNLNNLLGYKNDVGKKYDSNNQGTKTYNDTRSKLQYLGNRISEELNVNLSNNYNEKPNKMAGRGQGFVLKEYILTGFLPVKYKNLGNSIFIKMSFYNLASTPVFGLDIDVNFSDENNKFNKLRNKLQEEAYWSMPVDNSFPADWDSLLEVVTPIFDKQLNYIETFLSNKKKMIEMDRYIEILKNKKQIILQGPPGTGKTYTAKDVAEYIIYNEVSTNKKLQKKNLEKSGQFELVQFHPSYSYEDFVRGITAKSEEGSIVYETENKVLGKFAEKALNNLTESEKDINELSKEHYITNILAEFAEKVQDEIDEKGSFKLTKAVSIINVESDAFRYTGEWKTSQRMKFKDIVKAELEGVKTRQELIQLFNKKGLASQHSTYFIKVLELFNKEFDSQIKNLESIKAIKPKLKKYVLLIDEINRANLPSVLGELIYALEYRGESVESMYAIDDDFSITIPENLYIIGTMNTADRSVGHIDYAIKRRFAFIDILPNQNVIKNEKSKEVFNLVEQLFSKDFLASDFDKNDVQLGHSYFILKEESDEEQHKELQMRLKYEIVPILNEYVKDGLLLEKAKEEIEKIANFEC